MKLRQEQFFVDPNELPNEVANPSSLSIDRRRFLQYAAGAGAMLTLGRGAFGQAASLASSVSASVSRLPDGTEHASWEQPMTFTKTYYVDNKSAKADDNGPRHHRAALPYHQQGSPGFAARRAGRHRRRHLPRVRPAHARRFQRGSDDQLRGCSRGRCFHQRIGNREGLEAGSRPAGPRRPSTSSGSAGAPLLQLPFPPGAISSPARCSPTLLQSVRALPSVAGDRAWLDTKVVDMGPYFRKRGLVFVDGKPLEPVELQRELTSAKLYAPPAPGTPPRL